MMTFALYRILGNDLPPRHGRGQTLENLRFILDHEPLLAGCEKRWVVNRIVDPDYEQSIIRLLKERDQHFIHIPFSDAEFSVLEYEIEGLPQEMLFYRPEFQRIPPLQRQRYVEFTFRQMNRYTMNINGARNAALREGRGLAEWVMPWDGSCFVKLEAWQTILDAAALLQDEKYLIVPMARVHDNALLLSSAYCPGAVDEPQIIFRRDAAAEFDESLRYGYGDKSTLLTRLQVPGPWSNRPDMPWEPRQRAVLPEAGKFKQVSWVARLSSASDVPASEANPGHREITRYNGIIAFLSKIQEDILRKSFRPDCLLAYNESVLERTRVAWQQGVEPVHVDVEALLASARGELAGFREIESRGCGVPADSAGSAFGAMMQSVTVLALAWYFTREQVYAVAAVQRLLPTVSAMTQLQAAENQPGVTFLEDEFSGLFFFLDAIRLLIRCGELPSAEQGAIRGQCSSLLNWLLNSRQGRCAFASLNRTATKHDLLVASLAAFLADTRTLLEILRISRMRIRQQFMPDGSQPEELCTPQLLRNCISNMIDWSGLERLARATGYSFQTQPRGDVGNLERGAEWIHGQVQDAGATLAQAVACADAVEFIRYILRTHQARTEGTDRRPKDEDRNTALAEIFPGVPPWWWLGS